MNDINKIGKTLCLNMIVKNEVANLERCLSAVAPYISCWVIGDTGSTDGTQDFIRSFFGARGIPGELHNFPFENFSQARNEALKQARASKMRFDYVLFADADMELTVQNPEFSQDLTSAAYRVLQRSGVTYWNTRLLCRDVPAIYRGVTHEFLDVPSGKTVNLEGISYIDHGTGSNRIDKYERDAKLLKNAIVTERDQGMIARYTFYLANTLRDSGQKEAALETYLERARLGDWRQEVYVSLLNAAEIKEELKHPDSEIIAVYEDATASCPTRAEALHGAARFCRNKAIYETGYQFAKKGLVIPHPNDGLFVRDWVYDYGLLDELAVCAYWTTRYAECVAACDRLLGNEKLPTEMRERVVKNKAFAVGELSEATAPALAKSDVFLKLLCAAREKERLGHADDDVISAYLEATAACPTRGEALHGAACFCRNSRIYERGFQFAEQGLRLAYPKDTVGVEDWIYEYGLLDEWAVCAYWTERYTECVDACERLLTEGKLPANHYDRVLKNKQFAVDKLAHGRAEPTKSNSSSSKIPRIFHFITGMEPNFGGRPFSFVHSMAIRSALQVNKGFRARVYYHYEPSGKYWDAIKDDVELIRVEPPTEVFGNPVQLYAHKADVLRLQILLEHGGIYLDLDTICQRSFEPLLDGRVVMGREEQLAADGTTKVVGLCNATIIAPPNAEFLRLWYETYREFKGGKAGDAWNKFSVQIPMALASAHPSLLHIEPASSFFWPSWDRESIASMFVMDCEFPEAYSFHLWEGESWKFTKDVSSDSVMTIDTTYNKIARRFVKNGEAAAEDLSSQFEKIYDAKHWGQGSGVGSMLEHTIEYRDFLKDFMQNNGIRSVIDLGCGDWKFSRYIDWTDVTYVGIDVVPSVVLKNQQEFGNNDNISFRRFDSLEKLPPADLLICKDVLQHLPNDTVKAYLATFRNKYKFALITNDEEPADLQNIDIAAGGWRTLRLDREPFREPGAVVLSWTVPWGKASTKKLTFLLQGARA
jgi:glycosyltransferase involved in cell wall biosynthesis/SAM-dependent methyltransferase